MTQQHLLIEKKYWIWIISLCSFKIQLRSVKKIQLESTIAKEWRYQCLLNESKSKSDYNDNNNNNNNSSNNNSNKNNGILTFYTCYEVTSRT